MWREVIGAIILLALVIVAGNWALFVMWEHGIWQVLTRGWVQ